MKKIRTKPQKNWDEKNETPNREIEKWPRKYSTPQNLKSFLQSLMRDEEREIKQGNSNGKKIGEERNIYQENVDREKDKWKADNKKRWTG